MPQIKKGNHNYRRVQGVTLIELLIGIAVASLIFGVVVLTLRTSLDTYHYVQDDIFLQKVLDETLDVLSEGDFETYGLKDALEIISASPTSLSFVPLWVDDSHYLRADEPKKRFVLNRPFKRGSTVPIGEVLISENNWQPFPVVFYLDERDDVLIKKDQISLEMAPRGNHRVRFLYQPDAGDFEDVVMTIRPFEDYVTRIYKNKRQTPVPLNNLRNVSLENIKFQYFDNTNHEIKSDLAQRKIADDQLMNITAVKLSMDAVIKNKSKKGSVFVNLRNTRSSGSGLIIRKGTKIRIANSRDIRVLSLINIVGVREGGRIVLEAKSDQGQTWRLSLELGTKDGNEVITRYSIDYPAGSTVYSDTVNLTTDLPLNFLTLGATGRYDYDYDEDVENKVELKGNVELTVVEMDAAGAALFVRP